MFELLVFAAGMLFVPALGWVVMKITGPPKPEYNAYGQFVSRDPETEAQREGRRRGMG